MKRKEFLTEIGKLDKKALVEKRASLQEELLKLEFRRTTAQVEQSHVFGNIKRNIARINTVLAKA